MAAAPKKDAETTATPTAADAAAAGGTGGPTPDGIAAVEAGERTGLRVPRYFTTPGVHPYDELEWELRDAVIKNWRDNSVSFEQLGVEFPTTWSMNATTIVAQKYFRGQLGTPERERSVKQMVDRVADTITEWGREDGYFVDDESAETFNHELKHLLVNQKMAFNSPVWFNIGVKDVPQQASACFILAVEDTMSSILNWYVEEGIIFKGGSGAGVNLSKIRSSKENLRGGGEASGPVSFMRGADASAGTIKSGGKTRRAAKMVILNSNHPDIEDFIWCKAREEKKARVLREAGFDMDLDSPDYASIQYQNANNSVRVDDDFMRAWENDEDYDLIAVTTGEPVETKKARDLMRQIAQAAWECADPGMQYDTTINRWHTAPESGRINGSNPCSEYMHLDNSACNLASLNLKKFYDYEADRFDVEAYERAVDITITAQEILVGNSSYPTEKIGETARAFRQLGLGYANLGGLLMSLGLPYDSDEGRAWCGALTALMTGRAYRTSAQVAAVVGPFAGYAKNASAMANVIKMHRAAADEIDPRPLPEDLLAAAKRSWQEADEFGAQFGWRNSQASVLAPTGCLVGGTLVPTERGLVRLTSLGDPAGDQWQDLGVDVMTDEGPREATRFYVNGLESVVTVSTARGYRIQGTPKHRIKVVTEDGSWEWKRFADLEEGDRVPLALDQLVGEPQEVRLPPLAESYWTGERHATAPRHMTPQLAEFVGYFMGDGSLHARGIRMCVTTEDFDVVDRLTILGKELFNLEAHISQQTGYTEVAFHSVRLVDWWEACGFAKHEPQPGHSGKGWTPHIPDAVLHSNDRAVYAAFLRGLFEADGTVTTGYPHWMTSSFDFSQDVQALLLAMGYPTTRKLDRPGWGESEIRSLRLLNSSYNERWLEEVGFISDRKNAAVQIKTSQQSARMDFIPVTREMIDRVAADNDALRRNLLQGLQRGRVSRTIVEEAFQRSGDADLGHLLGFFYDEVVTAELGEDELTYDLSVPDNVTYVANGFVSHNTISFLMDCDTTGIEPDLGLVKTKKLVGGGSMSIVNQTVPQALRRLGYNEEQVEAIVEYIDEHKTLHGAPVIRDEHRKVFQCAMGDEAIHYMGHVKMMAAAQPFISGAISKCVVGETLIATEDGLVRIGSLYDGEAADSFRDHVVEVASLEGTQKTDAFYYGGVRPVREVVLRSGHRIVGTPNHRLLVATDAGLQWKMLHDIQDGDHVATQYGSEMWSPVPARFDDFAPSPRYGSQKDVTVPTEMTEDLAFLLGAYVSEGHTTRGNWTVSITNSVDEVLDRVADAWRSVFGIEPRIDRPADRCPAVVVSSKTIVEFLEHLGAGARASEKRIPDAVLRSTREQMLAFLQGLALDAYAAWMGVSPKWAICVDSPALLDDLQAVLTNLGVVHGRISKLNKDNGKTYDEVYAVGLAAQQLIELVPFVEPDKRHRAETLLQVEPHQSTSDVVPGITPRELYELIPYRTRNSDGVMLRTEFNFLHDPRTKNVSRRTLERVAAIPGIELPDWIETVLADGLHFSPVASVEDAGQREVFDVSVPTTHAFVGNGVVNHNTANMPEEATVEDVEQLFYDAWQLGLKAIAIYRDNCKVAQPLAVTKKDGATVAATGPVEVTAGMVRRKLPKQRPSQTISFRVADAEGYLTAGEYPGDGLGEIFVKLGKQGSTLSGVMDAFAISMSLGLQYGVPLEAYVSKFMNMRFEPAGMTDDDEIRFATSIVDYLARKLAIEYLPADKRAELGIYTTDERTAALDAQYGSAPAPTVEVADEQATPPADATVLPTTALGSSSMPADADAPLCFSCGIKMKRAGSCHVCEQCGSTSGCS